MIYVPDAEAELALDRTIAFCRRLWSDGDEEPDALRTIVATQSLSWDTYHIVELAAFEAVLRIKRGEPFDAQTFADRFGDCAAEIYQRCRVSQLFHLQFHGRPLLDSVYRVPSAISEVQAAIRPSLSHLSRQLGHKLWQATSFRAALIFLAVMIATVGIVAASRAPLSEREFTAGVVAVEQHDWDAAIEHLSVVVANDPDNAEAHYQLARAYLEVDNAGAAMQEITVAIRLNDRPEYFAVAGDALLTTNSVGAARQSYEMAIDGGIEDVATLTGLGHSCLKMADFDAADSALSKAVAMGPNDSRPFHNRAMLELNRQQSGGNGDLRRAMRDIDRALELAPNSVESQRLSKKLQSLGVR